MAVGTFRQLLECAGSEEVREALSNDAVWEMFEDPDNYQDAFTILAK